uniref:Uncharacterized protein n=1 Tax=Lepeophtheirus salmonis TaxID=72036 RepID=A0A0K2V5T5_LEPSM
MCKCRNDCCLGGGGSPEEVKGGVPYKASGSNNGLVVVASDGKKMPPFFFKAGEKIGQEPYYKKLRFTILPWLKATYPEDNYVCTQDGAPSHTLAKCQKFCIDNMADFWDKDMWPSSSRDLIPLHFPMWGTLDRETNQTSHPNVDSLKAAIVKEWNNLSEKFIINS